MRSDKKTERISLFFKLDYASAAIKFNAEPAMNQPI